MKLVPFTYVWIIKRHLKNIKTILDVGCGDGSLSSTLNCKKEFCITGIELFVPYIKKAKKTGAYKNILKNDIREIESITKKKYEGVLCSQVIEHLTKKEGNKLLKEMQNITYNIVLVGTPNGYFHRDHAFEDNELQKHHSGWTVEDFQKRGYKVYGQGIRFFYAEDGLINKLGFKNRIAKGLIYSIAYLLSPISYFLPRYSAHLIAVYKK